MLASAQTIPFDEFIYSIYTYNNTRKKRKAYGKHALTNNRLTIHTITVNIIYECILDWRK